MGMEYWWNGTSKGKPKYSGGGVIKAIPMSRIQQNSHVNSPGLYGKSLATNGLNHDSLQEVKV